MANILRRCTLKIRRSSALTVHTFDRSSTEKVADYMQRSVLMLFVGECSRIYLRYFTVGMFSFYNLLLFLNAQLRINTRSYYIKAIQNITSYSSKIKNNYAVKYFSRKEFQPLRLTLNLFVYNYCCCRIPANIFRHISLQVFW